MVLGNILCVYRQKDCHIGITHNKLIYMDSLQLNLFSDPQKQVDEENLERMIDKIR